MIKDSLPAVKRATFCVLLPDRTGGNARADGDGLRFGKRMVHNLAHDVLTDTADRLEPVRDDVANNSRF